MGQVKEKVFEKASTRGYIVAIVWGVIVGLGSLITRYFLDGSGGGSYAEDILGMLGYGDVPDFGLWFLRGLFWIMVPVLVFTIIPHRVHKLTMRDMTLLYVATLVGFALCAAPSTFVVALGGLMYEHLDHAINRGYDPVNVVDASRGIFLPNMDANSMAHFSPRFNDVVRAWNAPAPMAFPIDKFIVPILSWIYVLVVGALTIMILASLVRGQYIDREALPFPNLILARPILRSATEEGKGGFNVFKNVWFPVGAILGLVLLTPYFLAVFRFIDTSTFGRITQIALIIPAIPITLSYSPGVLGLSFIIPLEILISFFITWIVWDVIIVNVFGALGYIAIGATWSMNSYHGAIGGLGGAGVGGYGWFATGVMIVVALWPIIRNRQYWRRTLSAITKPDPEFEQTSPLPYRWLWLGFIILIVMGIAFYVAIGAFVFVYALTFPLTLLWYVSWMRLVAETGGFGGSPEGGFTNMGNGNISGFGRWWIKSTVGDISVFVPPQISRGFSAPHFRTFNSLYGGFNDTFDVALLPTGYFLEGFVLAKESGLRAKDVFVVAAAVMILVVALGIWIPPVMYGYMTVAGSQPFTTYSGKWEYNHVQTIAAYNKLRAWRGYWYSVDGTGSAWPTDPVWGSVLQWFFVGLIVAALLYVIRARYPRFTYNPIALLLFTGMPFALSWYWFPMLISLILHWVIIRTKGVKFYHETIIPLAVGLIFAVGLHYVVQSTYSLYASLTYTG